MFFDELLEAGDTRVGGRADANAHLLLFGHFDINEAGDTDHRRFAIAVPVKRSATVACGCTFKRKYFKISSNFELQSQIESFNYLSENPPLQAVSLVFVFSTQTFCWLSSQISIVAE